MRGSSSIDLSLMKGAWDWDTTEGIFCILYAITFETIFQITPIRFMGWKLKIFEACRVLETKAVKEEQHTLLSSPVA